MLIFGFQLPATSFITYFRWGPTPSGCQRSPRLAPIDRGTFRLVKIPKSALRTPDPASRFHFHANCEPRTPNRERRTANRESRTANGI